MHPISRQQRINVLQASISRVTAIRATWVIAVAAVAALRTAHATEATPLLDTVTVVATGMSNMSAASAGDISQEQMLSQPLLRPAAVLENVPGLIVTQHSGEGKANQYFLRAFNLDHGTDLALEVDDMPVNLPTHAHGQGYSDLNFLIPQLAGDLHYKKGPYYADEGDFATVGTARIGLVDEVPASASLEYGEDGYRRVLAMGSTALGGGALLGAGEVYHNDGPFEVPDDYNRLNGVLRYHHGDDRNFYTLTAMAYSGQLERHRSSARARRRQRCNRSFRHSQPHRWRRVEPLEPVVQPREAHGHRPGAIFGVCHSLQAGSLVHFYLLPQGPRQRRSDAAAR